MNIQISDERLSFCVKAAKKAGDAACSIKNTANSKEKSNGSIVTEADVKAEKIIREQIKESCYTDSILGEEQGGNVENKDRYWVIDPIDGTKNFAYEQPFYGTAVALVEDNQPVVGVFYMPELEYLFYAVENKGAYKNSKKLSVSDTEDPSESYLVLSGVGRNKLQFHSSELSNWNQQNGSALMGECWVSAGWNDAGIYGALAPWDIAVGYILIKEAGGISKAIADGKKNWNAVSEGKFAFGNEQLVNSIVNQLSDEAKTVLSNSEYKY